MLVLCVYRCVHYCVHQVHVVQLGSGTTGVNKMDDDRPGFFEELFRVEREIIHESSLSGRVYYIRRRKGMFFMFGLSLIAMGLLLIVGFLPNAGEPFKSIGTVLCILGAIIEVGYLVWVYCKWQDYRKRNENSEASRFINSDHN